MISRGPFQLQHFVILWKEFLVGFVSLFACFLMLVEASCIVKWYFLPLLLKPFSLYSQIQSLRTLPICFWATNQMISPTGVTHPYFSLLAQRNWQRCLSCTFMLTSLEETLHNCTEKREYHVLCFSVY